MDTLRNTVRAMKALSDPTRLKILLMLHKRRLCVCEMTRVLGISQPGVSRHLKILEHADLLRSEKDGVWTNYRIATPKEGGNPVALKLVEEMSRQLKEDPEVLETMAIAETVDRAVLGSQG